MVAYSFQGRFIEPILAGTKRQTIRAVGKRRHARPGDALQLYTGMRTKWCRKIGDASCELVQAVTIDVPNQRIYLDGKPLPDFLLNSFAERDGFARWGHMLAFWIEFHGQVRFEGNLIQWHGFVPAL